MFKRRKPKTPEELLDEHTVRMFDEAMRLEQRRPSKRIYEV